jgi:membrane fusion protein (multidrug efflux system)
MAEESPDHSAPETARNSTVDPSPLPEKRDSAPPPQKSNRRRNIVILVVAVVALGGGVLLWLYLSSYESTDDAQADIHLYPVSARVSGYVIRVNVDDNQWVEKGTVLVEVDPKDY